MTNPSLTLTVLLAAALVANLFTKLWLSTRQVQHVSAHRAQVPAAFAQTISLEAHQKAADYTLAKSRIGLIDLGIDAMTLLGWTLLGGLDALNQVTLDWLGTGMTQQVVLVVSFVAVSNLWH